jgi:2-polyprenyl-3-methyl-5-hydroxy-6-metoxy-1,4-benzoquinol methylase
MPRLPRVFAVPEIDSTNYEKFRSGNPVVLRLINRFYGTVHTLVESLAPDSVLDAGCGEGETVARLADALPRTVAGIDVRPDCVAFSSQRFPWMDVSQQSVYQLAFPDRAFDLVLCLEVLEHLDEPEAALAELSRVSRRDLVLSVPHEPWFRAGSLLRGKHVARLGNHPEHLQQWDRRSFAAFLTERVEVVNLGGAFPWLIAHCRPRPGSG